MQIVGYINTNSSTYLEVRFNDADNRTVQNAFENIHCSLIIKYKIFASAFVMTAVPNNLRQYYL